MGPETPISYRESFENLPPQYIALYDAIYKKIEKVEQHESIELTEKEQKEFFQLTNNCLIDMRLNRTCYIANYTATNTPLLFYKMMRTISDSRYPIDLNIAVDFFSQSGVNDPKEFLRILKYGIEWLYYSLDEELPVSALTFLLHGIKNFGLYFQRNKILESTCVN